MDVGKKHECLWAVYVTHPLSLQVWGSLSCILRILQSPSRFVGANLITRIEPELVMVLLFMVKLH